MKRAFTIGLTGGIATGKTEVLKILRRYGVPVVSSDELAHACLRPGHSIHRKVVARYGRKVLRAKGRICRISLGKIVFSNTAERKWLEQQVHPWVIRRLKSFIRKHRGLIVLDIPLLFEAKLEDLVDAVVVVSAPASTQISRLKRRNDLGPASARQRIRAQLSMASKRKRADYIIENNGSLAELNEKIRWWLQQMKAMQKIA